jgi:hypothetical protein
VENATLVLGGTSEWGEIILNIKSNNYFSESEKRASLPEGLDECPRIILCVRVVVLVLLLSKVNQTETKLFEGSSVSVSKSKNIQILVLLNISLIHYNQGKLS